MKFLAYLVVSVSGTGNHKISVQFVNRAENQARHSGVPMEQPSGESYSVRLSPLHAMLSYDTDLYP